MATDECLGAHAQGRASVLIQNGDWRGILSAAHRKHRGDGKSKWVPKSEPAASGTGSYGFIDTGGEMVTPFFDPVLLTPFPQARRLEAVPFEEFRSHHTSRSAMSGLVHV